MALFGVGSKATFNFKVQVKAGTPSGTVLTGKGTIGSVLYDPDKTNNTATAAVTVQ
jgi:hypothetical protein